MPPYLSDLLHPYQPPRTLRSLDTSLLSVPRFCLETFGRRSFSVFGPTVWNSLPLSLRKTQCFSTFKKKLKTHLFEKHLSWYLQVCSFVYVVQLGCVCVCVWYAIYGYGSRHDVYDAMKWFPPPPPQLYVCIFLVWACVYMYSWIRCRVDLYVFFSDVLTYCVMLQAFICYFSYVSCLWCMCVRVCVCVCCYCSLALFSAIEHV